MKNYLLDWAYSATKKQRKKILEDMLTTTQAHSLTTTDPDQVLKVEDAQHYVKTVTDISSMGVPPTVSVSEDHQESASAIDWLSKAEKPTKLSVIPSGDVFEIEKKVDPYWLLADNLEQMYYNRERYVDCKQCGKVISLDNGGRFQRKFCSDYCRKKDHRENKNP